MSNSNGVLLIGKSKITTSIRWNYIMEEFQAFFKGHWISVVALPSGSFKIKKAATK